MSETDYPTDIDVSLEAIIEAMLFAAGKPLTLEQITALFPEEELPEIDEIKLALENLKEDYEERGIALKKVASGYRFQVRQSMIPWVMGLWSEKAPKYTRALLEILALIAYRQPITRGEIEEIRGVSVSSNIIRSLQEREWVRIVGRRDVPGRPAMYATTRQFLDHFNLANLNELPPLSEIQDLDVIAEKLESSLQKEFKDIAVIHREEETEVAEKPTNKNNHADNHHDNVKEVNYLVDHDRVQAFKDEAEKADQEVFASVDDLLASVKTDFTDYSPTKVENAKDNSSSEQKSDYASG